MRLLSAADTAGLRSEYAALLRQSHTQAARDSEDASDSDDGETPGLRPASGDGRHRQCPCGLVRSCHVDQCPCGNRVYFPVAKPRRRKHRAPRPQSMRRQAASQRAVSQTSEAAKLQPLPRLDAASCVVSAPAASLAPTWAHMPQEAAARAGCSVPQTAQDKRFAQRQEAVKKAFWKRDVPV